MLFRSGDLRELPGVPLSGEGSCGGGGAPRDSAGSGATEEGLTSMGGRKSKLPSGKKRQPTGLCLEASICKEWVSFSKRRPPDLLRRQKFQRKGRGS